MSRYGLMSQFLACVRTVLFPEREGDALQLSFRWETAILSEWATNAGHFNYILVSFRTNSTHNEEFFVILHTSMALLFICCYTNLLL
jgi:hypothetical protein